MDKESSTSLSSSEFIAAMAHLYRGEMNRTNIWRTRLDVTTNWAIVTTAAFLSVAFGSPKIPHFIIILATIFVLFFLFIESRRYKYYDLWRWRVALINENFFSNILAPNKELLHDDWKELLSEDLKHTYFKITFREAFGRRLRRNYSWIFLVLAVCWLTKISIHPTPVENFSEIWQRAAVFHIIPGWIVITIGGIFNTILIFIGFATVKDRDKVVRIQSAGKR